MRLAEMGRVLRYIKLGLGGFFGDEVPFVSAVFLTIRGFMSIPIERFNRLSTL